MVEINRSKLKYKKKETWMKFIKDESRYIVNDLNPSIARNPGQCNCKYDAYLLSCKQGPEMFGYIHTLY